MEPEFDPIELTAAEELMAADLFSVGCIIGEIYSGQPLFNFQTIQNYRLNEFQPDLSSLPGYLADRKSVV